MIPDRETWEDDAACRHPDIDQDIFFPEVGGSRRATDRAPYLPALAICATCPVTAECLAGALLRCERHGVWGGTTPGDRQRMGMTRLCRRCDAPLPRQYPSTIHNCPTCRADMDRPDRLRPRRRAC